MVFWTWKVEEPSVLPPKWVNGVMEEDSVEDCRVHNITQQKSNLIITEQCNNGPLLIKKGCTEIAFGLF